MRRLRAVVPLVAMPACAQIVGADFDGLKQGRAGGDASATVTGAGGSGNAAGGSGVTGGGAGSGNTSGVSAGGGGAGGTGGGTAGGGAGGIATGGMSGSGGAGGVGASGGTGGGGTAGVLVDAGVDPTDASGPALVVLNEIRGQGGDDFIELYNLGPGPADLSGYNVSDGGNSVVFPAGTIVAQGAYLIVLLADSLTPGGPFTCFSTPCFHDTWGVSANGETVLFRDPTNQILDSTVYPDETAPGGLVNGQTWGRLPNGRGAFQPTATTPGAENTEP